jgi:hypothetical protein
MSPQTLPIDLGGAVWLRRDAIAEGITDREIRRRCRENEWHRVRRGAYVSAELWSGLSAADRHRVLCRAVLRTAHHSSVLSHISAAVERGVPVWDFDLTQVHLTRTDGKSGRREDGLVHHRGQLGLDEVEIVNGVPVTPAARVAIEVCTIGGVERSLVVVNGLLHDQQATLDEIVREARATRHWPYSLTTDLVTRLADARLESVGETRSSYVFWSQHLPRPEPQVEIFDEAGLSLGRVDFAWTELGVFLEFDGREKYWRYRREGESLEDFLLREKRREELICQVTGWVCIRITWADLSRPAVTAGRIHRILESRVLRAS